MQTTGPSHALLTHLLDTAALRHKVIAQNVANVNTPGYQRREVTFGDELSRALKQGGDAPLPAAQVVEAPLSDRVDGNTVDIDREMSDITKNSLLYQAAIQVLTSRIASLRAAVSGR